MQVQRTLVKSPPELWSEVSDVDALTRHLAAFGPITITRVEPESTVAWEGEHASGTVELTASGWGTKVTLTATAQEPRAVPPAAPEPEPPADPPALDAARQAAPPSSAHDSSPARRRWLRFWRRDESEPASPSLSAPMPGPPGPPLPDPAPPTPGPQPGPPGPPLPEPTPPMPSPPAPPDPGPQIAFDPADAETLLTHVLDDLGQAHRRPFSH